MRDTEDVFLLLERLRCRPSNALADPAQDRHENRGDNNRSNREPPIKIHRDGECSDAFRQLREHFACERGKSTLDFSGVTADTRDDFCGTAAQHRSERKPDCMLKRNETNLCDRHRTERERAGLMQVICDAAKDAKDAEPTHEQCHTLQAIRRNPGGRSSGIRDNAARPLLGREPTARERLQTLAPDAEHKFKHRPDRHEPGRESTRGQN